MKVLDGESQLDRVERKLDEMLALLHRAEPMLGMAERWTSLRSKWVEGWKHDRKA